MLIGKFREKREINLATVVFWDCESKQCEKNSIWDTGEGWFFKQEVAVFFHHFSFILCTNATLICVFIYPPVWYKNFPVF